MAGHLTTNTEHLTRSEIWSRQLKTFLEAELFAQRWVRWLSDFPDGDMIHIPSTGQLEAKDYQEGQAIQFSALDTGDFTFQITEYLQSGTYITNKAKQDLYYANELVAQFLPREQRALMARMEKDALRVGVEAQAPSNANLINGAPHRWIATGDGQRMHVDDFARARHVLRESFVPMANLVAIVDSSVEFALATQANVSSLISPNPKWAPIVNEGISTGMQFKFNIHGFDVYVSDFLVRGLTDTIYNETAENGVANLFFSAAGADINPIVGAIRQPPKVDSRYNMELQRDEYATTCRYGMKLYRPENFVTVISNKAVPDPVYT